MSTKFRLDIWEKRYRAHGDNSIDETFWRVANALAETPGEAKSFYEVMASNKFMPAGRVLRNAGGSGMMVNCFHVPMEDNLASIFEALSISMKAQAEGGGVGYNLSNIRPRGSKTSKGGTATGPCSFIDIFDTASGVISGTNDRKAANIAVLNIGHPDIMEFITAKRDNSKGAKRWTRFNISVDLTAEDIDKYPEVWQTMLKSMWECGDPGIFNLAQARANDDDITGVNPCGEQPLPPYGSCCLGSIILPTHVSGNKMNMSDLVATAQVGQLMLYRIATKGYLPHPKFEEVARRDKRIGVGITGYAHALIKMGIKYSKSAPTLRSLLHEIKLAIRSVNSDSKAIMTIAPTGTTSLLCNVSSGIEPIFETHVIRKDNTGTSELVDPLWGQYPAEMFETAKEIDPYNHLKVQIAAQKEIDAAVSKTINLPASFSQDDLDDIVREGLEEGLKGMTVYRDGSLPDQILNTKGAEIISINTPQGKTRVIVGTENGKPKEVYLHLHKPGGDGFSFASALGRVISIGLQEGASVERIAQSMIDIGSTGVVRDKIDGRNVAIQSVPDAIGKVLLSRFGPKVEVKETSLMNLCPDCGKMLTRSEGCETCGNCGFSRC